MKSHATGVWATWVNRGGEERCAILEPLFVESSRVIAEDKLVHGEVILSGGFPCFLPRDTSTRGAGWGLRQRGEQRGQLRLSGSSSLGKDALNLRPYGLKRHAMIPRQLLQSKPLSNATGHAGFGRSEIEQCLQQRAVRNVGTGNGRDDNHSKGTIEQLGGLSRDRYYMQYRGARFDVGSNWYRSYRCWTRTSEFCHGAKQQRAGGIIAKRQTIPGKPRNPWRSVLHQPVCSHHTSAKIQHRCGNAQQRKGFRGRTQTLEPPAGGEQSRAREVRTESVQ